MGGQSRSAKPMAMALLLLVAGLTGCDQAANSGVGEAQAAGADRWSYQDWPTGPYQVAQGWPRSLRRRSALDVTGSGEGRRRLDRFG